MPGVRNWTSRSGPARLIGSLVELVETQVLVELVETHLLVELVETPAHRRVALGSQGFDTARPQGG